jgi:hypothetical protein
MRLLDLDSISLSKSSEKVKVYWAIIDSSLHETTNQEDQELYLVSAIEKLTPQRNDRFRLRTDKSLDSYNPELWCAAYIVSGGCSDGDLNILDVG